MNRLRRPVASLLAAALLVAAPGPAAQSAFAQVFTGAARGGAPAVVPGAAAAAPMTGRSAAVSFAPTLLPAASLPLPAAPALHAPAAVAGRLAAAPVLPSASVPQSASAVLSDTARAAQVPAAAAAAPAVRSPEVRAVLESVAQTAPALAVPQRGSADLKHSADFTAVSAPGPAAAEPVAVPAALFGTLRPGALARAALNAASDEKPTAAPEAAAPVARPSALARAAALPGKAWGKVRSFGTLLNRMAFGDPELRHLLDPHRKAMRVVAGLMTMDGLMGLGMAFLVGPLLDTAELAGRVGLAAHMPALLLYSGLLVASFIAYLLTERGHVLRKRLLGLRYVRDVRVHLMRHLQRQETAFHLENGSGALASRLKDDTNYLSFKYTDVPLSLLHYSIYGLFGAALMFYTHWPMALVVMAVAPFLGVLNARYGQKLTTLHFSEGNEKAELMRRNQEVLSQAGTVKSFAAVGREAERYAAQADALRAVRDDQVKVTADYTFALKVTDFFTKHLVYIVGGALMAAAMGLSFGHIVQMTMYAGFVSYAFQGLSSAYISYKKYDGASSVIRDMLAREPAIKDPAPAAEGEAAAAPLTGAVRFEGVDFSYNDGTKVLDGLTFEAAPGQTVAFVGGTGSGKSTVSRLLLRLYEPQAGRVLVDGRDVREMNRADLLKETAVVPQDTRLFNETIRFNMLYGSEDASEEELARAVRMAKADFVYDAARFPKGLDTEVAEGGARLSGGERQRVAIVRAFLRRPKILVLDEATSALDNESERVVQAALDDLAKGDASVRPTTFVVAHRLSTIRHADRINVLEKGRIVESGTHEELLAAGGRYAQLWNSTEGPKEAPAPKALNGFELSGLLAGLSALAQYVSPAVALAAGAGAAVVGLAVAYRKPIRAALGRWAAAAASGARQVKDLVVGDAVVKPFLKKHRKALWTAVGLLALDAVLWNAGSHLLGLFLDAARAASLAGTGFSLATLGPLALGVAAVFVVSMFTARWNVLLTGFVKNRLVRDLRVALNRKVLDQDMSFHLANESAALATRISDDTESLAEKNVDARLPLVNAVLFFALSSVMMVHTHWGMSLLVFAVMPFLGVINGWFGSKFEEVYNQFTKRRADLGRTAQETLEQIQTVKVFSREDAEVARYATKAQALVDVGEQDARLGANSHMFASSLTDFFTKHSLYILGAWSVALATGLTIGEIAAMTFYSGFIKASFDSISGSWMKYKQTAGATDVIRSWFDLKPGVADAPDAKVLPPVAGEVAFEGVAFQYGADGQAILDGVSLKVRAGETVAFVGESGSGKSTVLRLVQRLWDPSAGTVKVDGVDIRTVTQESLNRQIALVPQDTRLFDETIRFNMLFGADGVSQAELDAAIKAARAEFVYDARLFPEGLETKVGEGGARLSGGQRQRVAIVRAILKKPAILLLDEATSALDKETEAQVQAALDDLASGRAGRKPTTLVVAHNLTTVMNSDRIVVMDRGRVVEVGTHAELLAKGGKYAALWAAQGR